jgi:hypothetical protein
MSSTAARARRTHNTAARNRRSYRGDASAFTVAVLSMMVTAIAAYDLCIIAISMR